MKFKAIILAGGSGERFWPLSTPEKPKQFLKVFGGDSLIRQSVSRLGDAVAASDVHVITSRALVAATRRELPEVPRSNIVGEPMRRDTGAAVALGVAVSGGEDDDVLAFFPSDQLVAKPEKFRTTLAKAVKAASKSEKIVVLGIRPDYPATTFGYVNPATGAFVEKPDLRKAKRYLKDGYLWNAGMFIARRGVFKRAFARFAAELTAIRPSARVYEKLPRISFDYAVMEKLSAAGGVKVIAGDFGWDDVGSYGAFDRYYPHDANGNVLSGETNVVEAEGNIAIAKGAKISLLGVKNLVVVTTKDSVLVAEKSRITEMKRLFAK